MPTQLKQNSKAQEFCLTVAVKIFKKKNGGLYDLVNLTTNIIPINIVSGY